MNTLFQNIKLEPFIKNFFIKIIYQFEYIVEFYWTFQGYSTGLQEEPTKYPKLQKKKKKRLKTPETNEKSNLTILVHRKRIHFLYL